MQESILGQGIGFQPNIPSGIVGMLSRLCLASGNIGTILRVGQQLRDSISIGLEQSIGLIS